MLNLTLKGVEVFMKRSQKNNQESYWDAQITGLDPEFMPPLTFNVGTGSIEKVSRIRDKYNLSESYWSDREATGYKEK